MTPGCAACRAASSAEAARGVKADAKRIAKIPAARKSERLLVSMMAPLKGCPADAIIDACEPGRILRGCNAISSEL